MTESWECPACGERNVPKIDKFKEGDDADGNRFIWVQCIECPVCEESVCTKI